MVTASPERACARARVRPQISAYAASSLGFSAFDDRRALLVPELTEVEVALDAIDAGHPVPAEHDVAGGLHQPLTLDHPLGVIGVLALPEEWLEHRGLRFVELQEQWIVIVAAETSACT